jgi:hypothetical protein
VIVPTNISRSRHDRREFVLSVRGAAAVGRVQLESNRHADQCSRQNSAISGARCASTQASNSPRWSPAIVPASTEWFRAEATSGCSLRGLDSLAGACETSGSIINRHSPHGRSWDGAIVAAPLGALQPDSGMPRMQWRAPRTSKGPKRSPVRCAVSALQVREPGHRDARRDVRAGPALGDSAKRGGRGRPPPERVLGRSAAASAPTTDGGADERCEKLL